jgi:inorganic pyrophosphatase
VASHDIRKNGIRDLSDVPRHLLNEIGHFFDIYKELEPGKSTDVRGWMDRAEAERVVKDAEARAGTVPSQRAEAAGQARAATRRK